MSTFAKSISQVFRGSVKSFYTFPATILCAVGFAIVTMVRIQMDWPQQEAYNLLFNCLHWSFALGALFSLTAITAARSSFNTSKAFRLANILGGAVVAVSFALLYFLGGTEPTAGSVYVTSLEPLAVSRVSALMMISMTAFILIAAQPKEQSDFERALFMTQKALFIALIYGLVLMGGTSGVAGAFQSLLYRNMSSKVYMYLSTLVGFVTFTIFVGYFPDFSKDRTDEKRETAQKQPRFIEVLFGYIMLPIMMALTLVLLLWTGKTVAGGMKVPFLQLSGIATGYAAGGIWLHIMTTHYETGLAKFYRRIFPFTALVILAFEAWALVVQLQRSGLKTEEYIFVLFWILTISAALMLLMIKEKAHDKIAVIACILVAVAVLPAIGIHALPVTLQASRLENLLTSQNMLENGQITAAAAEPERSVREAITDSVMFLSNSNKQYLPKWFDKELGNYNDFKEKLGFEPIWPEPEIMMANQGYIATTLSLPNTALDISGYRWVIFVQNYYSDPKGRAEATIEGEHGTYRFIWSMNEPDTIPLFTVELNGKMILEKDIHEYFDRIEKKYPPGSNQNNKAGIEDMTMKLETETLDVLLLFNSVEISLDPQQDRINHWVNLQEIYIKEK